MICISQGLMNEVYQKSSNLEDLGTKETSYAPPPPFQSTELYHKDRMTTIDTAVQKVKSGKHVVINVHSTPEI